MRQENGYFTVEAALVLPIVISVFVLLIYLIFFQYNRCLLEQDAGALALKGCTVQEEEKDLLMQKLRQYESGINLNKYMMWNQESMDIVLKQDKVKVTGNGELKFPFYNLYQRVDDIWHTSVSFENHRVDPVGFIRMYRKITGGK